MPQTETEHDRATIRDRLAYDRTELANERTLLAYLRTSIALLAGGGILLKFFPEIVQLKYTAQSLIVLGCVAAIFGVWRFIAVKQRLRRIAQR